jgi:RNA polymerase sigma-70 factor (ECF subfamily)
MLYEHYYGYALKIVFRYVHRYDTAVDIVNDGFVKVFKNIEKFEYKNEADIEKMLMGWVRSIMINASIDELRKKGLVFEIGGIPNYVWEEADKGQNADQKLLYKELMIQVKKLPPVYRIVFNMFAIDGFQHHEIAETLGITVGTSKSNLSKARALLQKFIKEQEAVPVWAI